MKILVEKAECDRVYSKVDRLYFCIKQYESPLCRMHNYKILLENKIETKRDGLCWN